MEGLSLSYNQLRTLLKYRKKNSFNFTVIKDKFYLIIDSINSFIKDRVTRLIEVDESTTNTTSAFANGGHSPEKRRMNVVSSLRNTVLRK